MQGPGELANASEEQRSHQPELAAPMKKPRVECLVPKLEGAIV